MKIYLKTSGRQILFFICLTALMGAISYYPVSLFPYYLDFLWWAAFFVFVFWLEDRIKLFRGFPNGVPEFFVRKLFYLPAFITSIFSLFFTEPNNLEIAAFFLPLLFLPILLILKIGFEK